MEFNLALRECNVKIVYYGPGLSGKTTNLEVIHDKTPVENRGNLTTLATDLDRTLYFDYMPLELGKISGLTVRLRLFTVPGQVYYNATRKLVLRCADGVVFVADSQESQKNANLESLKNLEENLLEYGLNIKGMPLVLQFNKRDLPNIMSLEKMDELLNQELHAPYFPAIAVKGDGVFQCLRSIANLTMVKVEENLKDPKGGKGNIISHQGSNKSSKKPGEDTSQIRSTLGAQSIAQASKGETSAMISTGRLSMPSANKAITPLPALNAPSTPLPNKSPTPSPMLNRSSMPINHIPIPFNKPPTPSPILSKPPTPSPILSKPPTSSPILAKPPIPLNNPSISNPMQSKAAPLTQFGGTLGAKPVLGNSGISTAQTNKLSMPVAPMQNPSMLKPSIPLSSSPQTKPFTPNNQLSSSPGMVNLNTGMRRPLGVQINPGMQQKAGIFNNPITNPAAKRETEQKINRDSILTNNGPQFSLGYKVQKDEPSQNTPLTNQQNLGMQGSKNEPPKMALFRGSLSNQSSTTNTPKWGAKPKEP